MDRIRARTLDRVEDFFHDDIGLVRGRRANMDGLIRHLDMERIFVGVRINGNSRNAHPPRGLDDTTGDFTAISD